MSDIFDDHYDTSPPSEDDGVDVPLGIAIIALFGFLGAVWQLYLSLSAVFAGALGRGLLHFGVAAVDVLLHVGLLALDFRAYLIFVILLALSALGSLFLGQLVWAVVSFAFLVYLVAVSGAFD